jgi:TatD DNase family protein
VREPTVDDLRALAALAKVVAIGETGLDYYRLNGRSIADMAWQRERFRVHIRAARIDRPAAGRSTPAVPRSTRLPLLRERGRREPGGCLPLLSPRPRGRPRRARPRLSHLVFRHPDLQDRADLREVAAFVPLDRCLIETDSPYLAPAPFRGKVNTPANVPGSRSAWPRSRRTTVEAIAEATSRNFELLFLRRDVPRTSEST